MIRYTLFIITFLLLGSCVSQKPEKNNNPKQAKNIILLIGDGMGVAQIYSAISTSEEKLNFEQFKIIGFHKTHSATDYITDSGAGGTALATGVRTCNSCISIDTLGNPLKTILEFAEENKLATGLVSTSSILHATPASFISHVSSRNEYEKIATFFLKTEIDVFIGGGKKHFMHRKDSLNLIDSLINRGYLISDSVCHIPKDYNGKLAVFTAFVHNPYKKEGRTNMLPDATEKAIEMLSKNDNGFFLMVEGSEIDWGGHDNDIEVVVSETIDFDKAIGKALEFAKKDGETLVVVTADHETGGLTLVEGDLVKKTIVTNFSTDDHTGVMVPVFAFGPGAEKFGGIYNNTEVFEKMMSSFNFKKYSNK
ncbi:MAG: alkaline phosphatase [Bacteroidales bacterium]